MQLLLALILMLSGVRSVGAAAPTYSRVAALTLPGGIMRDAVWLDRNRLLVLEQQLSGASVVSVDYDSLKQAQFISPEFMAANICPPASASGLQWTVAPGKRYICFRWPVGAARSWALLDISTAPRFRLKRIQVPGGMQVAQALFSPDERYLALIHDGTQAGSSVAALVMDLTSGNEVWRVDTHSVNFIDSLWWGGAVFDTPRFFATAKLYNGEFFDEPGLALFDVKSRQLSFVRPGRNNLLLGSTALWGRVDAYASGGDKHATYELQASVPGHDGLPPLTLSTLPLQLQCLSTPGLALVSNTADYDSYELWLVNVLDGTKTLVDRDCGGFDVAVDNHLLVRSRNKNELRIYQLKSDG